VVAAGKDANYTHIAPGLAPLSFIRAARLITPLVVSGITVRSVWQSLLFPGYRLVLSPSDLTTTFPFLPLLHGANVGTPFPGPFVVEPDFPVTVL